MIVCVAIPYVMVAIERLDNPGLIDQPVFIGEALSPGVGLSREAVRAGVEVDMLPHQVKAICPQTVFLAPRVAHYQRIIEAIEMRLLSFSWSLEAAHGLAAVWYMAVREDTGIAEAVYQQTGLMPQIGIARSKFSARLAAMSAQPGQSITVPDEETQTFLADFALRYIPDLKKDIKRRLHYLGIYQLGQIAAIPALAWQEQLGRIGLWLHELATGQDPSYVPRYQIRETLCEGYQFEPGVANLRPLQLVIERLCLKFQGELSRCYKFCRRLLLEVTLEDGSILNDMMVLREPTQRRLAETFTEMLVRMPLTTRVADIKLTCDELVNPVYRQLRLFEDTMRNRYQLQVTLGNLVARYGREACRTIQFHPARLPEQQFHLVAM
jgi:nucleotidyltransferase/DNA polymerase involved in DNA repair